jgi:hypothetical protein
MKQFLYIILILLLLYYFTYSYKNIECFNVGIPKEKCRNMVDSCLHITPTECKQSWTSVLGGNVKCEGKYICTPSTDSCDGSCQCKPPPPPQLPIPCNDCKDCSNHGIASGKYYPDNTNNCSCTCKDGWSGNKCEKRPGVKPLFPDKIQRLPWNHEKDNDGYGSIFLDKMNGEKNGSESYTSRLDFTTGPDGCNLELKVDYDYKNSYNPVIYKLAQYGFQSISMYKTVKSLKYYKYRIEINMNLTKDNMPNDIHWYQAYIFEFKFYVRVFYSLIDFQNMNKLDKDKKPMNTSCDTDIYSLKVSKFLNTDTINFNGSVDFNITGNQKCPKLDHLKSTARQEKDCITKSFCTFDDGTIYNSCDNKCSNDGNTKYIELYRMDIKLIQT